MLRRYATDVHWRSTRRRTGFRSPPTGLIHDAWNIRLVPHYWLAVFLVLSHLSSGLSVVLTAHGVNQTLVFRLWLGGLVAGAVATVILSAMCGLRLSDFTS